MRTSKRRITLIGALLLTIFSWYWCSITLFSHDHDMDRVRVTHSHPLAGSTHTHSTAQLQTISFLAMFLALVAPLAFSLCKFDGLKSKIAISLTEQARSVALFVYSLRAPPAATL